MSDKTALTWGVSRLTDAPNVIVMGGLIALLIALDRRYKRMHIRLWIVALALIFFDELIWLLPSAATTLRTLTHTTRLLGQILAGTCLLLYEEKPTEELTVRQRFVLYSTPALLALQLVYGLNVTTPFWYVFCAACAIVLQLGAHGRERALTWYMASLPALWVLIAVLALYGNLRSAAYFATGYVYLSATRNAWLQLKNAYAGRYVVTISLLIWTASFFVHPYVMIHKQWSDLAEQTWAMQKFIVTFGLVVVLFEEETREHEHLSQHDNLTGLANRRRLQQVLQGDLACGHASVLLIDLNGFKQVNDAHGHAAGDCVLQEIAQRLSELCLPGELIARVGGDEFIIASRDDLTARKQFFADAIAEDIQIPGSVARVSGSIGIAIYPADASGKTGAEAVSTLLNTADLRMYTAKHRLPLNGPLRERVNDMVA